jgi:hypothetical protein
MSAWRKPLLYCSLAVAVFQIATFRDLYVPSHSAPSAEGVALLAAFGAACIAASLLVAWLAVRAGGLVCALLGLPLLAAGLSPNLLYWHDIAASRDERAERDAQRRDAERRANQAHNSPPTQAQSPIEEAQALLDSYPEGLPFVPHSLIGKLICTPMTAQSFALLRALTPPGYDDGKWLDRALQCHSEDAVRSVLDHGASLAKAAEYLHQSDDPNLIAMLIEHGAAVDARIGDDTPLMRIRSNHITRVLLKHGADPNAHTKWGSTALHRATRQCYEDPPANCFEELLQAGADPMPPSEPGFSPRDYSARNEPDHRPHPALVAAEHAWRCAMLVPDDGPALPGCTTPPVSQKLLLERLLDPALFEADLATAQALLAPLGPFYKLTPLPTVRQLRRITEDYIFLVGFEPAQQPELSHPWLVRLRLYVTEDELRAAIKPFTLGELGTDEEHHVPIFRLPGARSIVVYDDSEPGVVVDLHRAQEPDMREKARRAR